MIEDPSCGGPVDDEGFCPSIPCGGEGGGGSSVVIFLFFFLDGAAYAEACIIGTKLCGDVYIGGSSFHCRYGIVLFFQ